MHFHVGHNMPGYMPNGAPHCTDSADNALAVWRGDIRFHIEDIVDDRTYLDADTWQNTVTLADVADGVNQQVENEIYWIEPVAEPIGSCELRQEQREDSDRLMVALKASVQRARDARDGK